MTLLIAGAVVFSGAFFALIAYAAAGLAAELYVDRSGR